MTAAEIMIAADIVRGVTVLGLLFVRTPSMVWLAYAVTAVTVGTTGFFEPARSSTVPSMVNRRELVAANAMSTSTWSAMVAIGASLAGLCPRYSAATRHSSSTRSRFLHRPS